MKVRASELERAEWHAQVERKLTRSIRPHSPESCTHTACHLSVSALVVPVLVTTLHDTVHELQHG